MSPKTQVDESSCFAVKNGKTHRLVGGDPERFPLGRAKCAPFPALPADKLITANEVKVPDFCRMCL